LASPFREHKAQGPDLLLCFESFDALLDFMLRGLRIDVPDTG
jgi:hypothetical protein